MIRIRTALNNYLKTLHPRVYFQDAPKDAPFPYIVYSVSMYPDGEGFERVVLDIDGWDSNNNNDATVIENLMQKVNGYIGADGEIIQGLDKKTLTTDNMSVVFYLDSKLPVEDTDKRIKRRKYSYTGKLYNRS